MDEAKRSHVMSMIKSRDTKPELIVRRYLFAHGFRYRVNVKSLPGTPDIVLRKYKTVIFVNGCFWHGHDCVNFRPSRTRVDYWMRKIIRNKVRDENVRERLRRMGWRTMVVWECQLKKVAREKTLEEIVLLLEKAFLDMHRQEHTLLYKDEDRDFSSMVAEPMATYRKKEH